MAIRFRCPNCRQLLSIASRKAGHVIECPICSALYAVPHEDRIDIEDAPSQLPAADASPADAASGGDAPPVAGQQPPAAISPGEAAMRMVEREQRARATARDEADGEGLALRRARIELGQMDLTPMVDVTFLLLIFFMITASFSLQKAIPFPPPEPDERGAVQTIVDEQQLLETSIEIEIDERNVVYLDDVQLADSDNLVDALLDRMRADQKTELLLKADAAALHETVVSVVDAANEAGMQKIRLAGTREPSD